ncbi:hypothetical protein TBLA_0E04090 [Henningerozyma blattae CBS 6284]|uniref:Nuclear segregation protein BFR1 n=1 Tax=Henningerozyma blattae (strain ATCC 34711 / CBS 6284 / DSM 70876 / NBRC 10599 / NRRL Y-10934 / UCD 77-7) TaxID=1071380 RepID=I2H512_HENB6|nr:hypothetical protein TBLA_0E04090 [Tetrapisispora blattae CBS 6284]CCH61464.1 hypothetical protein TBLA_0E04090 [Tetrapisispora blattae CBS 6284]
MADNNNNNSNNKNNYQRIKRPDTQVRDRKLDVLRTQLKKIDVEIATIKKQIDSYQIPEAEQEKRKKLHDQTKSIIKTQAQLKTKRNEIHESIKALDASIKRKNNEINDKIGKKNKYQTTAEIKQRINDIEDSISSGDLTLVEEKLLVKEMQSLNKINKDLLLVEPIRKSIEQDKTKITELKSQLNAMNPKELSSKFDETQKDLNDIQSKTQSIYDKRQSLFNKRSTLYGKRDEIWSKIRTIQDDFDNEFKSYKQKLEKERLKREEDEKLSKLIQARDIQLDKLQERLSHAKKPAFTFEIEAIENSLQALDPTYVKPTKDFFESNDPNNLSINKHVAIKTVEDDTLVPIKKQEVFTNTPQSKSKKHKKKAHNNAPASSTADASGKFTLEASLIAVLAELDVTVPTQKEDAPKTIEQLKAKHEEFLTKQDEQTEKNIAAVEAEIAKLNLAFKTKEEQIKKELAEKRAKEQAEAEAKAVATEAN